jgi:catechol 2,3-dioxygenase-like lactoylglutathione lyase family enzyme
LNFYKEKLGLKLKYHSDGWAEFDAGDVSVCLRGPWEGMIFSPNDFGKSPDELLFTVEDIGAVRNMLQRKGISVEEIHTPSTGLRVAEFKDPDGRRIAIESRENK